MAAAAEARPSGTAVAREARVGGTAWVLFAEARHRRRRRLTGIAVSLAVVLCAATLAVIWPQHPPGVGGSGQRAARSASPEHKAARPPLIAWVDDNWRLHVGNLGTRIEHVVTEADAEPAMPLVQAGGRVYWIDTGGTYVPSLGHWSEVIRELDLATGRVRMFQPGQWIFPSADGRQLYLSQIDNESLIEVPAAGSGAPHYLTLPAGWYLPGGLGVAVAGGIVVQSDPELAIRHPPVLAIWSPGSGQVKVIGRGVGADSGAVISAYTPPGDSRSLLAWMPATCRYPVNCPIRITSIATLSGRALSGPVLSRPALRSRTLRSRTLRSRTLRSRTLRSRTLRSPLPYGFALGGAFSPDGRQLAVFVNRSPGTAGGTAQLAIVSTRTGTSRLVPGARFRVGEDVAWARWLPGGKQLIAGGVGRDYIVTAATCAARPFRFRHRPGGAIGYSAVVVPQRQ
jgi:hypothetical protein